MSRNPDGSVLALSSAADEAMEGFKWHQPPPSQQNPHETTTATALVSLTPVAPVSQSGRGQHQPPQNNNQDVINLQYMELEEFLLENAVAVTVPEHKAYQQLHDDPHPASSQQHHGHHQQQPHPVSLEQRPPGYPGSSLANNVLQIMSSAAAPSEVKREQDGDEVVVDPLLPHRNNGNNGNNHPMTPPDHQNDVIMKVGRSIGRTMSGPANGLQTASSTEHLSTTRRTNSLCEPNMPLQPPHSHPHPNSILPHQQQNNTDHHGHHVHHIHGNISPPAANVVLAVNTSPNRNGSEGGMDNCLALSPSSSASSTSSSSDCGSSGGNGAANPRVTRGAAAGRNSRVALAMQSSVVAAATSPRGSSSSSRRLRKEPVPEASKDDKYWKRRAKNNAAAKRSRDLRREKENSILNRVQFLEGQNQILNQTLVDMKQENADLKERLARYEAV